MQTSLLTPNKLEDNTAKMPIGEPAPPRVVSPEKGIQNLPRFATINQPDVAHKHSMEQRTSSMHTPGRYVSELTQSHRVLMAETGETDVNVLNELFTTSFKRLRNRNKFLQYVFLILGLRMAFALMVFAILHFKKVAAEAFSDHIILILSISTFIWLLITVVAFFCSNSLRNWPNNFVALILISVAVILQHATLAAYFKFTQISLITCASLMIIFFTVAVLGAQKKREVTDCYMFLFIVILSGIISCLVGISLIMTTDKLNERWISLLICVLLSILFISLLLIFGRHIVHDESQQLTAKDFLYGTLILSLSVTTLYVVKMVISFFPRFREDH